MERNKFTAHQEMARQLQEDMRETDNKKRVLEDQLDQMNAELNALKQQEQKAQGNLDRNFPAHCYNYSWAFIF